VDKVKTSISMDDELYDDMNEVLEDSHHYGFQNRSHLVTIAVRNLLIEIGYYSSDDDDDDDDDDE